MKKNVGGIPLRIKAFCAAVAFFFITGFLLFSAEIKTVAFAGGVLSSEVFAGTETEEIGCPIVGVEFADGETTFGDSAVQAADAAFSEGEYSLKNYISVNTNGMVSVFPSYAATVRIEESSSRFTPAYLYGGGKWELVNEAGYDNRCYDENGNVVPAGEGRKNIGYFAREQELLRLVLNGLAEKTDLDFSSYDRDGDGEIDGLCLLFGSPVTVASVQSYGTGTIFWPHQSAVYYGDTKTAASLYYSDGKNYDDTFSVVRVGNKIARRYLAMPFDYFGEGGKKAGLTANSVLCHEFMHVLGVPDYYPYDGSDTEYVGELDIMDRNAAVPQLSLSYIRQKSGWLEEGENILAAETEGDYTLFPVESGKSEVKAYKIALDDYEEKKETFYVEYRSNRYPFGKGLSDSGLIIYRVNESNAYIDHTGEKGSVDYGNMYGEPEIYVFRDWQLDNIFTKEYTVRKEISSRGKCYAYLGLYPVSSYGGANAKRNLVTYSDGENSGVALKVLSENPDGSISFHLDLPVASRAEDEVKIAVLSASAGIFTNEGGREYLSFDYGVRTGEVFVLETEEKIGEPDGETLAKGEYGATSKVPVSFRKTFLKKSGGKKYVYVCARHGNGYTAVSVFEREGTNAEEIKINLPVMAAIVFGATVAVVIVIAGAISNIGKRRG